MANLRVSADDAEFQVADLKSALREKESHLLGFRVGQPKRSEIRFYIYTACV